MWFSRKIFVAVTSACVMKQRKLVQQRQEYELNYNRLILPTNVTEQLLYSLNASLTVLTKTFVTVVI